MTKSFSNLERMIDKFLELDVNKDGAVTKDELILTYKNEGLNDADIEKWMEKYDVDLDGKVSLEEFCRGLGLKVDEMNKERKERTNDREGRLRQVTPDIQIIATTMSKAKQLEVTDKFKEVMENVTGKPEELNRVAELMKDFVDEKYGRVWQVVLVQGSYWMKFSHEPFMSLQFKMGPYIFLAWRTPSS